MTQNDSLIFQPVTKIEMTKLLPVPKAIITFAFLLIAQVVGAQTFNLFGSTGNGPLSIATDASGNVWVSNSADNTVTKLNPSGSTVGTFPVGNSPINVAIDASGNAWVTNYADNTVSKLGPSGTLLGTYPVGNGPFGIAIDGTGNIWVVNNPDNTVSKLSPSGAALGTFPIGGSPNYIAIDVSGNVYVVNDGDNTVSKLSPSGSTLGTYAVGNLPNGIATDVSGNVYVVNNGDNTVSKLSPAGAVLGTFAVGNSPVAIAIDKFNNVWVANNSDNTVSKLSQAGAKLGTLTVGNSPNGLATDNSGNVFVINNGDNTVFKLSGAVLPIEILSFTGTKEATDNLLDWKVTNAVGFASFKLQREDNGVFSTIATIPYYDGRLEYSYKDLGVIGDETYRLELVDLDGKVSYSNIVFIPRDAGNGFMVKAVYPVPTITTLNISLYAPAPTMVTYSIVDMNGKVLMVRENSANGAATQTLDVSGIAKGSYILNIKTSSGVTSNQKFVKM
jgi:DNA-binding beta-propeller fold protein YncE